MHSIHYTDKFSQPLHYDIYMKNYKCCPLQLCDKVIFITIYFLRVIISSQVIKFYKLIRYTLYRNTTLYMVRAYHARSQRASQILPYSNSTILQPTSYYSIDLSKMLPAFIFILNLQTRKFLFTLQKRYLTYPQIKFKV